MMRTPYGIHPYEDDKHRFTIGPNKYFAEDQIAMIAVERVEFNAHGLGDNTTAGPIVGLVGTA